MGKIAAVGKMFVYSSLKVTRWKNVPFVHFQSSKHKEANIYISIFIPKKIN